MPRLVTRYNPKIVKIERDFASLRKIRPHGDHEHYYYEIDFDVDQISALRRNVLRADIYVYLDRPPRERSLLVKNPVRDNSVKVRTKPSHPGKIALSVKPKIKRSRKSKPRQLIRNLQMRASFRKDIRKKRKDTSVLRRRIDFTAFFDNSISKLIRIKSRAQVLAKIRARRKITMQTVKSIKKANKKAPILKIKKYWNSTNNRKGAAGCIS